jgi:hypothetical protein
VWWYTPAISAAQEAEIRRIAVGDQWAKSCHNPILTNKPGVVHTCNSSYAGGIGRKIAVWGLPWEKM